MALTIKLEMTESMPHCYEVEACDVTGGYDESSNPGGYGNPNIEITDIEDYTLEVFEDSFPSDRIIHHIEDAAGFASGTPLLITPALFGSYNRFKDGVLHFRSYVYAPPIDAVSDECGIIITGNFVYDGMDYIAVKDRHGKYRRYEIDKEKTESTDTIYLKCPIRPNHSFEAYGCWEGGAAVFNAVGVRELLAKKIAVYSGKLLAIPSHCRFEETVWLMDHILNITGAEERCSKNDFSGASAIVKCTENLLKQGFKH